MVEEKVMVEKILREIEQCDQFEEYRTGKACVRIEDVERILLSFTKAGQVKASLPEEIQKNSRTGKGTLMELFMDGDSIILKKCYHEQELLGLIDSLDIAVSNAENKEEIRKHINEIKTLLEIDGNIR